MSEQRGKGLKAELKDPKTRLVLISTALVLLLGLAISSYLLFFSSSEAPTQTSTVTRMQTEGGTATGVTTQYASVIKTDNKQQAELAKNTGGSAVPKVVPDAKDVNFDDVKKRAEAKVKSQQPPAPPVETNGGNGGQARYSQEQMAKYQAAVKAKEDRMKNSLQQFAAGWGYLPNGGSAISQVQVSTVSAVQSGGAAQSSSASGIQTNSAQDQCLLLRSGDTCYGEITTGLNSDDSMWASARIIQCKTETGVNLAGSVLSGNGKVNSEWASGVEFKFNVLASKAYPKSMSVSAVSLDENTNRPAVESDKDTHLASKILAASVLGMSSGVNDALENGGREQQVINTDGSQSVQTDAYTNKQILIMGATRSVEIATKPLESVVSRPTTHNIENGRTIGIYFMNDVMGDCSSGRMLK